jgi:outer membrane protein assembly factor BamB
MAGHFEFEQQALEIGIGNGVAGWYCSAGVPVQSAFITESFSMKSVVIAVLCFLFSVAVHGDDWPVWLGPAANGISSEKNWKPKAVAGKKVAWEKDVGEGYSAPSIRGDFVFVMGHRNKKDYVYCLKVADGAEVWQHSYPSRRGGYPGPRASAVVDGDFVYTISREGIALCLRAATGDVVWEEDLKQKYGAKIPTWGISGSPLVVGNVVCYNACKSGVALDKKTGRKVWSSAPGNGGYATPALVKSGGKTVLAIFAEKALICVDPRSGKEIWSYPWETAHNVNASTPLPIGDYIFVSSGYGRGCALLNVKGSSPKKVWENKNMDTKFGSCVYIDGYIYGVHGDIGSGELRCISAKTGDVKWTQKTQFGAMMVAAGKIIMIVQNGTLLVAEASPNGYKEVASTRVIQRGKCWTMPILSNGRIYCRNDKGTLIVLDVSK